MIVGTQAFGKGSVQTVLPLNNGTAIKLTTARYFTPNGRFIQAKGITPDIVVEEGTATPSAGNTLEVHEADLERHLLNGPGKAPRGHQPTTEEEEMAPVKEQGAEKGKVHIVSMKDYQFIRALNLLKGMSPS